MYHSFRAFAVAFPKGTFFAEGSGPVVIKSGMGGKYDWESLRLFEESWNYLCKCFTFYVHGLQLSLLKKYEKKKKAEDDDR